MSLNDILANEAMTLVDQLSKEHLTVRIFGGIAVWIVCPKNRGWLASRDRNIKDIDLICPYGAFKRIRNVLFNRDYEEITDFKSFSTHLRRVFKRESFIIELVFNELRYCHTIDMRNRFSIEFPTIPLADIFLSKIQNVNLSKTRNDFLDIIALLREHDFVSGNQRYAKEYKRIVSLLSSDWGFFKTAMLNLDYLMEDLARDEEMSDVVIQLSKLVESLKNCRKTIKWKLQRLLKKNTVWYNTVE